MSEMASTVTYENTLSKKEPDDNKSYNVIDLLRNLGDYQPVFDRLFEYFSGRDIHNFTCVSRTWRDAVFNMKELRRTKYNWRKKLVSQWRTINPKESTLINVRSQVLKIQMSGTDLFVDVLSQPAIFVYDITTYKLKHVIRAASDKSSCWDVHEDFLLIFDGAAFFIFDRHTHQEIEVLDSDEMQLGHHFKPVDNIDADDKDDTRIRYPSRVLRKDLDRPVVIKIYPDPDNKVEKIGILIVYCSGIVSRWSYQAVYQETEAGEKYAIDDIMLFRQSSIDISDIYTEKHSFMSPGDVFFQLSFSSSTAKMFFCPPREKLVSVNYSLKDDSHQVVSRLEGVKDVLYYYQSNILPTDSSNDLSNEGYILITTPYTWYVQQRFEAERLHMREMYEQGNLEGSLEEWLGNQVVQASDFQDEKLKYLEIYSSSANFILLRRMKVHNLCHKGACINDDHMILSTYEPSQMLMYNAKEILADKDHCKRNGINYVANPVPIRIFEYEHGISRMCLYMAGPSRLVFADQVVQVVRQLYSGSSLYTRREERYVGVVKCLDFWMA